MAKPVRHMRAKTAKAVAYVRVLEMLERGRTEREIAEVLGVTRQGAQYWIAKVRKDTAKRLFDLDEARVRQLHLLRFAQREAVDAWENSKADGEVTTQTKSKGGGGDATSVTLRKEKSKGDPAYLAQLRGALDDERSLLGLNHNRRAVTIEAPDGADVLVALAKKYRGYTIEELDEEEQRLAEHDRIKRLKSAEVEN